MKCFQKEGLIMNKNTEMKFYELLGIKTFRKMAFALAGATLFLFMPKVPKEKRNYYLYENPSNYSIGKISSLEDILKFKKKLLFNASIHLFGFVILVPDAIKIISGLATIPTTILTLFLSIINLYCVMLQRYNWIRINKLAKKMRPRYEKQKNNIKENIRKEDQLLNEHNYKIINRKGKETEITLEQLIFNATIKELKQYRDYLTEIQKINQEFQNSNNYHTEDNQINYNIPIEKNKTLRIELKRNNNF